MLSIIKTTDIPVTIIVQWSLLYKDAQLSTYDFEIIISSCLSLVVEKQYYISLKRILLPLLYSFTLVKI